MTVRVVIADDHRVVRDGLCYLLGQEPDIEVAGEAGDGRQTIDIVAATRPDVLLLDLYMPGLDGHAVIAALRDTPHRPAVVVLTSAADDEHLVRAMHAGATSYLLKTAPAEHVIAAVRDAAAGTASLSPELLTQLTRALRRPAPPDPFDPLSPREREVLQLIARGHSNRQIARSLEIGEQTVKTHVRSILTKLGLQDRVQAAIFALRHQPSGTQPSNKTQPRTFPDAGTWPRRWVRWNLRRPRGLLGQLSTAQDDRGNRSVVIRRVTRSSPEHMVAADCHGHLLTSNPLRTWPKTKGEFSVKSTPWQSAAMIQVLVQHVTRRITTDRLPRSPPAVLELEG
jgi:NarL family two-component system response regulator LiaR